MIVRDSKDGRPVRVLFLDDMAWRHSEFAKVLFCRGIDNVEVYRAWNAPEAIQLLKEHSFDQVFLDHDLDDCVSAGMGVKPGTGMDVVDFICSLDKFDAEVIVHSLNEPARLEMCRRLSDKDIRHRNLPFLNLLQAMGSAYR